MEAAADVRARVGNADAADVEHTEVRAPTINATTVQARLGGGIFPAIGDIGAVAAPIVGGDEERRQARDGLDAQRADPAGRWLADQDAAGIVRKGGRVENDHHAVDVVVAAVHPVVAVVPQALNVAVLRCCAVGRAVALRRAGVVRHGIRVAHVLHAGVVVAAAVADDCLAVPVGVLDDVEQPDGEGHQKVALPHGRTEGVDVASRGAARDVVLRLGSAVALVVAAAAVVASDVDHIALALAVSAVHVRGRDGEAVRCGIRDLDFQTVAALRQLVPELRDFDELARLCVVHHGHAAPRQFVVKRGAVVADASHVGDGVGEARRVVCAAQERCTRAVPRYAVDAGKSTGDGAGLRRRCGVVRSRRHADGDRRAALGLSRHRHRVARYAHRRHRCVAAHGADRAVATAHHRDGLALRRVVQRHAGGGDGEASRRLADAPRHRLGGQRAVRPAVKRRVLERERGVVAARVRAARRAAEGHFGAVVVAPRRALRRSGVGQASALRRHGQRRARDGDRLRCGLCDATLGVGDRDGCIIDCKRSRGREGVGRVRKRRAVGIGRHDHHASRVKGLACIVGGLCRRCHDGDASQLDAASAAHHVKYQTHAVASVLRMFTVRLAVGASLQWKVIFPAVVTSSA